MFKNNNSSKKYYTKSEILNEFSFSQLKELAKIFNVCKNVLTKEQLVQCLSKEKSISKSLLIVIFYKEGDTIVERVRNLRQDFYKNFIEERNKLLKEAYRILGEYMGKGISGNMKIIDLIEKLKRQTKDIENEKLPKELEKIITKKQRRAYYAVRKEIQCISKMIESILFIVREEGNYQDIQEIKRKIKNERIVHYLVEARKCYAVRSYDSTVVMIARAIEYILKEFFKNKNIKFSDKETLGSLVKKFKDNFHDPTSKRVLGKILEVQNLDRIVGAHDIQMDRKIITREEANHAWTAIQVILKELMHIEYDPHLE